MNQRNKPGIFAASGLYLLAAAGLLLAALAGGGMLSALQEIFPGISQQGQTMAFNLAYYVPFMVLPVLLWMRGGERRGAALRLNPISVGTAVKTAFMALLSMLIVYDFTLLWMALLQRFGLDVFASAVEVPSNRSELTLCILTVALIVPVCEELLFRGVLLSAWEERGAKRGAIVTAVLFAIFHGSFTGLPGQLFGGLMLAFLVLWTDSLYAGFIFHGVYNASSVIMSYMSGGGAQDAVDAVAQADVIAAIGGARVVPVLLLDIALMSVILMALARGLRMNRALRRGGAVVRENGKLDVSAMPAAAVEEIRSTLADPAQRRSLRPERMFGGEYAGSRGPLSVREWCMLLPALAVVVVLYVLDFWMMLGG